MPERDVVRETLDWAKYITNQTGGWQPDTMEHVFIKLDELHYPLTAGINISAAYAYRMVVELAVEYLTLEPNPESTRMLRDRFFDEMGAAEALVRKCGKQEERKQIRILANICLELLITIDTDISVTGGTHGRT